MVTAQTATLGGAALAPGRFGGIPQYSAPTVDLAGRDADYDAWIGWVVVLFIATLVAGVVALCILEGGDATVTASSKFGIPYKWTVTCDQ